MPVIGFLAAVCIIGGVALALAWKGGLLGALFGRRRVRRTEQALEELQRDFHGLLD